MGGTNSRIAAIAAATVAGGLLALASPAARAAPTCNDAAGRTVRCDVPGAMPVGWTPPPEVLAARRAELPPGPDWRLVLAAVCILGGFVTLVALLPDFEDGRGGGWEPDSDAD